MHDGYQDSGRPLGCGFRLYTAWVGQGLPAGVGYQFALRSYRPQPEDERAARKHLAWLELDEPFPPPMLAVQVALTRRLLAPGWQVDEYLLFDQPDTQAVWLERVRAHLAATAGRLGFRDAPVEAGDFTDWLSIGCHTARDGASPTSVPVRAAGLWPTAEADWLVRQGATANAQPTADSPAVFISYASTDFLRADAVRQQLERAGWACWIAPRDINRTGLPYTEAIPQAIRQARAVVVLLSPAANLSVHIPRELDMALERKLLIVPIRLADMRPAGQLEYLLRTCQWLDAFARDDDDVMRELTSRIRAMRL
jgi:hypothetical protein